MDKFLLYWSPVSVVFAGCTILVETGNYLTLVMEGEKANILKVVSSSFTWSTIFALPLLTGVLKLLYRCTCGDEHCE